MSTINVKVEGIELSIDSRVLDDINTLRLIKTINRGGDEGTFAALDLFDLMLGDDVAKVEKHLADKDGYCSAESYSKFCAKVFQEVGGKNSGCSPLPSASTPTNCEQTSSLITD